VQKSERACNPQTSTAANSVADYEALITCVSQHSEGFLKKKQVSTEICIAQMTPVCP
jgi:hypothetical protein